MTLIVQKYGGTSVSSVEQILSVAKHIASIHNKGIQLIVVVSAMSGETNRLLDLGRSISTSTPDKRELDALASTGEQVTIALLSQALKDLGIKAKSFCGWQIPIITSDDFTQARIKKIIPLKLKSELDKGTVVIVAGFQGISEDGDITTLGRGGSDTSAVAVAVALKASECQIYTDVNGVYTSDPNKNPLATRIDKINGVSMLEAASLGAKVLHVRSCELAYRYKTNIRVLSSFTPLEQGTLVMNEENLEHYPINVLSQEEDQVLVNLQYIDKPSKIICSIYNMANIDMLQIMPKILSFVVSAEVAKELLPKLNTLYPNQLETTYNLTKLSLIGSGFRSNAQQNSKVWASLEDHEVFLTSHNEISLSILVHNWEAATVRTKLNKLT